MKEQAFPSGGDVHVVDVSTSLERSDATMEEEDESLSLRPSR